MQFVSYHSEWNSTSTILVNFLSKISIFTKKIIVVFPGKTRLLTGVDKQGSEGRDLSAVLGGNFYCGRFFSTSL